jgi:hypothetical protein
VVSRKKMAGLIGDDEAVSLCQWPVANRYWEYRGRIQADPDAGWKWTMTKPLADPNLFRTFSNLGARGGDLPEATILTWVRKHGLLRLRDPNAHPFYTDDKILINQAPISLDEFRREVRRAYEALTLFEAIRSEDVDALRARIRRERIDPPNKPGTGGLADMFVDDRRVPIIELDCEPSGLRAFRRGYLADSEGGCGILRRGEPQGDDPDLRPLLRPPPTRRSLPPQASV